MLEENNLTRLGFLLNNVTKQVGNKGNVLFTTFYVVVYKWNLEREVIVANKYKRKPVQLNIWEFLI